MLNTENRSLKKHWDSVITRNMQDVCVFAPRRSGKTTAMVDLFIDNYPSLFVTVNQFMAEDVKRRLMGRTHDYYNVDSYVYSSSSHSVVSGSVFRGVSYKRVIFDELAFFNVNMVHLLNNSLNCSDRVVAVTTPNGDHRSINQYLLPVDFGHVPDDIMCIVESENYDHFIREEELFKI